MCSGPRTPPSRPDSYGNIDRVLDDFSWLHIRYGVQRNEIYDSLAVIYPRRHGKTLTETVVGVAVALAIPDGNVYVYNPTAEHAREWLSQAMRFLSYMKDDPIYGYGWLPLLSSPAPPP